VFSHSSTKKPTINSNQRKEDKSKDKSINISRIPLSISSKLNKSVLEKYKFYKEDQILKPRLYTQVLKKNINKFIKIKNVFSKLSSNKILKIHKVFNNLDNKEKSKLNVITYHMQVHLSRNYIPAVKSSPKHTSLPSIVATFLTTCLMVVL